MKKKIRSSSLRAAADPGYREWLHESLRDLPRDSAILVIGCEEAFVAPHLGEYAARIVVLDTSGGQIAQLAGRFPEIVFLPHAVGDPLPFARESFAAVLCCEVLDRVFDPVATLREIERVLLPEGRLLATVPDHGRVRQVLHALLCWDETFSRTPPRLRQFTKAALTRIARVAGFGDVRIAHGEAAPRFLDEGASRRLLLRATKIPTVLAGEATGRRTAPVPVFFGEELAFASSAIAA